MADRYQSWGRYPAATQTASRIAWRSDPLPIGNAPARDYLPFGNGRSYGDSCLNDGGALLDMRGLDRFLGFDPATGILRCEAGILLAEIIDFALPQGWFPPVTPGTKFVTVGGAIANDVHGKNHHVAGTFGRHVRRLLLARSDGIRLWCSPAENAELFAATIGGLGLTGAILVAEITLKRVASPNLAVETIRYGSLDAFFALSSESDRDYEYTVAWVDCLARGKALGRGLFMRGNHAAPTTRERPAAPRRRLAVPIEMPVPVVNALSVRAFNATYWGKAAARRQAVQHYDPFFYPLDAIHGWNRIYGRKGFMQYQCVVPEAGGNEAMREILDRVAAAREGSFLTILKRFGDVPSPGLMSFPRPGLTITLDFPNRGVSTFALLDRLDDVVRTAGGAVYPAKDARMSGDSFRLYFPRWRTFARHIDPRFSSSFWRRVTAEAEVPS
ncbi:MAG: FAD-binding oxidoreductase [Alphaproteobacteria bacterium]|nr:FAD-binding oxidoreductase [Alphaproteobacteria bacterium]